MPGRGVTQPEKRLDYRTARVQIYLPSYTWQLKNQAREVVRKLATEVLRQNIVLVDYFTNDDITDVRTPISHAGLLRKYIIENFDRILELDSNQQISSASPQPANVATTCPLAAT